MIRPLRRTHRIVSVALVLTLPAGLMLALRARVVWPLHEGPLMPVYVPETGVEERPGIWGELAIETRVWSNDTIALVIPSPDPLLELTPLEDLRRPDMLVYWSRATSPQRGASSPPADARLLGSLAGTQRSVYQLPHEARRHDGWLVLYSLAHREVIAIAQLTALGD